MTTQKKHWLPHQISRIMAAQKRQKYWLPCQASKGMFSSEVTVGVESLSGDFEYAFVPNDLVRVEKEQAYVKVWQYKIAGKTFAVLPDEYSSSVCVFESDLIPVLN